jgi:hypothetical protein
VALLLLAVGVVETAGGRPAAGQSQAGAGAIVFERAGDLFVVDAGGGRAMRLTTAGKDRQPAWSPDASRVAFVRRDRSGVVDLHVIDADGSNLTRLTDDEARESRPTWAPDGSTIAFARRRAGSDAEIWTLDPSTGDKTRLTFNRTDDLDPAWSPTRSQITFASDRDRQSSCRARRCHSAGEIYVMNADGSRPLRLTHDMRKRPGCCVRDDSWPSWKAGGGRIAFERARGPSSPPGTSSIKTVASTGGPIRRLLSYPERAGRPSFSPYGALAFSLSAPPGANARERIGVAGTGAECVRLLGVGRNPDWSPSAGARLVQLCAFMTLDYRPPTNTFRGTVRVPTFLNAPEEARAYGERCVSRREVLLRRSGRVHRARTGGGGNWRLEGIGRRGSYRARAPTVALTAAPRVRVVCATHTSYPFRVPVVQRGTRHPPRAILHRGAIWQRNALGTHGWTSPPEPDGLTAHLIADAFCTCGWPHVKKATGPRRVVIVFRRRQRPRRFGVTYWTQIDEDRGDPVGAGRAVATAVRQGRKGFYKLHFTLPSHEDRFHILVQPHWWYRKDAGGGGGDYFFALSWR